MSVFHENMLVGASGQGGAGGGGAYQISRSLRFNSPDSGYLSRTFGTPTTQGTFTFSAWVKRAKLGSVQQLFGVSTNHSFGFTAADALNLTFGGVSALTTAAVSRDSSAWCHIVWRQSGTAHTIYVNNVSVGAVTAASSVFNTAVAHQIGAGNTTNYFNGYLTDVYFIDGQALTPSSFGETDANTGEWIPKAYTGTYGTNGFKLDFADNSAATAAALGKDTSGNGNNWTPNNLSVTAGAGNDSLVDTPTSYGTDTGVGGEVRGNYATWNPLSGSLALSNGNLEVPGGSAYANRRGTVGVSAGKWYVEFTLAPGQAATSAMVGWYDTDSTAATYTTGKGAWYYSASGGIYVDGVNTGNTTAANPGDIIGMSLDADTRQVKVYLNNTLLSTKTVGVAGGYTPVVFAQDAAYGAVLNAGQRPFAYTAPADFKALCDTNLPTPTIVKPSTAMDVLTWTGSGALGRSFTGLGFSPDLVWGKIRSGNATWPYHLYDTVRGAGANKELHSNTLEAEGVTSTGGTGAYGYISSFDANGFTTSSTTANDYWNNALMTYVAWCWDAGSSNVVNTQGTITSTVRANPSAGFSIVTYTGTGSAGTVGHGLGVAPSMIILKNRDTTVNWLVYHSSRRNGYNPERNMLFLNSTGLGGTNNAYPWNNTAPTSTVFSIGGSDYGQMTTGTKIVAYCFAPVAGYSAFGDYTGNGTADGPFVYTGFRPQWILIKQTTSLTTTNWILFDARRIGYNPNNNNLNPNTTDAEFGSALLDIVSNGFKIRSTSTDVNNNTGTYVYAAFAEFPFQYARAR